MTFLKYAFILTLGVRLVFGGGPQVITNLDGRVEVFGIGVDRAVWHIWEDSPGGPWTTWNSLGGAQSSEVAVGKNKDGRLEAFALNNGLIQHLAQTAPGGGWAGWSELASGNSFSNVQCLSNLDGRLEIFASGTNNLTYHNSQTSPGGVWSGWSLLSGGGPGLGFQASASNKDGRLQIFSQDAKHNVWTTFQVSAGGGWSNWTSMGATPNTGNQGQALITSVILNNDGRLELFAWNYSVNQAIWHDWQTSPGGSWSGWFGLGGTINQTGSPAITKDSTGNLWVFTNSYTNSGTGNGATFSVAHQVNPGGAWTNWLSMNYLPVQSSNLFVGAVLNGDGYLEVFTSTSPGLDLFSNLQTSNTFQGWVSRGVPVP